MGAPLNSIRDQVYWTALVPASADLSLLREKLKIVSGTDSLQNLEMIVANARAETLLISDSPTVLLEMGCERKFYTKASTWEENRTIRGRPND
jgi:hypothetical protein